MPPDDQADQAEYIGFWNALASGWRTMGRL
jgi:hypothetical protein